MKKFIYLELAFLMFLFPAQADSLRFVPGFGGQAGFGGGAPPAVSVTSCGQAYNNFASSVAVTTTCTAPIGGRLVVFLNLGVNEDCTSGSVGISGVADSAGNTYARDVTIIAGLSQCVYSTQIGTQLNSGGTVTATCATGGSCEINNRLYYITPSIHGVDSPVTNTEMNGCGGGTSITVTGSTGVAATDIVFVSGITNNGSANPFTGNWNNSFTTLIMNDPLGASAVTTAYGWNTVLTGTPTSTIAASVGGGNCTVGTIVAYKE